MRNLFPPVFAMLCLVAMPYCHGEVDASDEIRAAIEHSTMFGKISWEDRSGPVLKFGAKAVPALIERYNQGGKSDTALQRAGLLHILCCIKAPEAKAFLKKILEDKTDLQAMNTVFQYYPVDDIEEILPLAMEVEGKLSCIFAEDRSVQAVRRNPKLAGMMIDALKDSPSPGYSNFHIIEMLRMVSGHYYGYKPSEEAVFWRQWWEANKNKTVFEWVVENYQGSPNQRTQAMMSMGGLQNDCPAVREKAVAFFLKALDDPFPEPRGWAIYGLIGTKAPQMIWKKDADSEEMARLIRALKEQYSQN